MRFTANGPSIPDDLLIARDRGDVIFFCGAGVSQANAGLPNFERLGREVIRILGSASDSPARRLLDKALDVGHMEGVGGLLATDRVFGLLEREFEIVDVRAAVAQAIRPPRDYRLDAHRTLLDLAKSPSGITRLVTTNFDLLFEECDPLLPCSGPPLLPDPRSDRDFRGIVHLHGRVDASYSHPHDDEFVVSSADFGRAYLSDGWATRFIQSLLARFQVVFVGYTADDPPVQYLLEALNLRAGNPNRLFAFQSGERGEAAALWEHRGVQAIPFDSSNGYAPLWDTLSAWARRARDVDGWHADILAKAQSGPTRLDAHVRGQIAHLVSTKEGARRIASASVPIDASWLLTFDAKCRYGTPSLVDVANAASSLLDPFEKLHLDFDAPPKPMPRDEGYREREAPENAWDAFTPTRLDYEEADRTAIGVVRGSAAGAKASLAPRLVSVGIWLERVSHLPTTLWWAAQQAGLHPDIKARIASSLSYNRNRFPEGIRRGWRLLFSAWEDKRPHPDMQLYEIERRVQQEGWSHSLIRELVALYRPRLAIRQASVDYSPLSWTDGAVPQSIVNAHIDYPRPHVGLSIPADHVAYATGLFRGNLELAISLEREIRGDDWVYFGTTRATDGGPELADEKYGLAGPIVILQDLITRWASVDPAAAREEVKRWPVSDEYCFARLRIWAAGQPWLTVEESAAIFGGLPDRVFWGSFHERDLLYALRDRWPHLEGDARRSIEGRLRTGAFPWDRNIEGGVERAVAYDRLSRLHWLSAQGVAFGFDVASEIQMLRGAAPAWTTRAGDTAADSHEPTVFTIVTDDSADPLLTTPISEILTEAQEVGGRDFLEHVERAPFQGLSKHRPARALGALTHVGRKGEAPLWAWSAFLYSDTRPADHLRMIAAIARRLTRLPSKQLKAISRPVSEWMLAIASRLYGDASAELDPLWRRLIEALSLSDEVRERSLGRSWGDDALNAPVGKLHDFLMKDPTKDGLSHRTEFPAHWTAKVEQLLGLPGDQRRHALVLSSYHLTWLYHIAPAWTEQVLLPSADDDGDDGDAFWDGVLWAARNPLGALFERLSSGLKARARRTEVRHAQSNVIAAFFLSAWLFGGDSPNAKGAFSDDELREVLIHADDQLRGQFIWHLQQLLEADGGKFRGRIIPFLSNVWPKQRAVRTPSNSEKLANLALVSGDLTPELVATILPRLVPIRSATLPMAIRKNGADYIPAQQYPKAVLELLWVVLAEDPRQWPYKIEEMLDQLDQANETAGDPRLSELRRRRER